MARYALVIGIAKYDNFTNLPKAVNDAEQIAQLLKEHGRFDVQPLPGKLIESENRWQVTAEKKLIGKELGQTLRLFLLEKAKGSEALIYFAGHGFEAPSLTGEPKGYLATSDCHKDGQNAIAFDDFNSLIAKSQLSSLVVLLDCCYAGSLLERSFIRSSFPVFNSKQDYCLITASRAFERAREDAEGGIFTKAVIKGLSQDKADDTTGEVNANDLMSFVSRELKGSGQEAIYMGGGRSISLVFYSPQNPVAAGVVSEECPYRGLQAFDKEHSKFFFGRQKVVNLIQQKLEQANFIPIIGASGSGKSSVVLAGLIPVLENNGWRVLEMTPDVEPLAELRGVFKPFFPNTRELYDLIRKHPEGLRQLVLRLPDSERFLLLVDQFEEVFTLCPKEEERNRFIQLLTQGHEGRLVIITTMRADFLEPCLNYESLTQLIQEQAIYMPPLLGGELEEAIASPANLQGYQLERGLLGTIQQDVIGQEKGCLPLLQFALTELWEQRDQQAYQLTVVKYKELGGVTGALNRHAENLYQGFTPQQQDWVKRIFLKLVRTGSQAKDTRQWQAKTKLLSIAGDNPDEQQVINDVLEKLIQGRLLVLDCEPTGEIWVDLAHEALMEAWERFAKWRKTGRELRRLIDRVEDAFREWQEQPDDGNLMMGRLLAQVQHKWQELEPELDTTVKDFYQHSVVFEQKQRQQYEAANNAKSIFLASVSHELRAPLNGMIGFLQLILAGMVEDPDEQKQFLLETHHLSIHLLEIINDILDIAKIEPGKMTLAPERFDIETLINNIVLWIKPAIEKNNNILEVDCHQYLGTMYADENRIKQVLLNLLSNAAKFTTNGKVTLIVKSEEQSVQDTLKHTAVDMIIFTVIDTGIGISDNLQENLFQPFTTEDTSKKYGGIGLGLAISHRLCQMMGGDIFVKSKLGEGSTFTVRLPRNINT
ncbi:caspase family protein [Calothrix membranacea FACHB-236]|nr:caspase family protein [Calothrix membranacea FACHB-236]